MLKEFEVLFYQIEFLLLNMQNHNL